MEIDLSRLPLNVRQKMDEIFRKDFDLSVLKAIERQTKTAAERRDRVRWHDEMVPQHEIDPFVDTLWRQFYGHNYTENPDLMRFLVKRNPEIFVKARSHKIQVGYAPGQRAESKVKSPPPKISRTGCKFGRNTIQFAT